MLNDDDPALPPPGPPGEPEAQHWACGPMGFWPVLALPPAVSWHLIPE